MITIGEQLTITFKGHTMTARIAGCDLDDGYLAFWLPKPILLEIVAEREQAK